MATNPYAAGYQIYGGGSNAATSGTVDPLGYITRELEKRRTAYQGGTDGQSDTRSGLAATALAKSPTAPAGSVPQAMDSAAASQQFYSMIGAGPTGQLQYPQLDLPFDLDLANERAGELNSFNQSSQESIQGIQNAAQNRLLQTRQLDDQRPDILRQLLNNFAGRGMALSSGYGTEVVDTENEINNMRAGIESEYNGALQNITNQGLSSKNSFLQRLMGLGSTQADRTAQRAADLQLQQAAQIRAQIEQQQAQQQAAAEQQQQQQQSYSAPQQQAAAPAAPSPTRPGGVDFAPTGNTTNQMSKSVFLLSHPKFAATRGAERDRFLANHPDIARAWARYN